MRAVLSMVLAGALGCAPAAESDRDSLNRLIAAGVEPDVRSCPEPALDQSGGDMRLAASCLAVTAAVATLPRGAKGGQSKWSQQVSRSAQWHLKNRSSTGRRDCSGLVVSILGRAGARVTGNTRSLWADAVAERRVVKTPRPGYLAFFDRTYDANRNGRVDDRLTHVAVVTAVRADGTVDMVHRGGKGISALRLNVRRPGKRNDGKQTLNDFLRAPGYGSKTGPRLAGQLLRGFARPPRP